MRAISGKFTQFPEQSPKYLIENSTKREKIEEISIKIEKIPARSKKTQEKHSRNFA